MSDNPRTHADYIEVVKLQANLFRLTTYVHTQIASTKSIPTTFPTCLTTHVHTQIASLTINSFLKPLQLTTHVHTQIASAKLHKSNPLNCISGDSGTLFLLRIGSKERQCGTGNVSLVVYCWAQINMKIEAS